jgi:ribonuclease Z
MFSKRNFKILGFAIAIPLLASLLIFANLDALISYALKGEIKKAFVSQEVNDDLFEVMFCGTGTPRFNKDRAQPCLMISAGNQNILFDAGQGALWSMEKMKAPWQRLNAVFITHLHSDHVSGLGEVIQNGWVAGRSNAVDVFGPVGIKNVVDGFKQVYKEDIHERLVTFDNNVKKNIDHIWGEIKEVAVDDKLAHVVYDHKGLIVKAFRVDHPNWGYAYGYRIEYRGKSVVFSGDTRETDAIAIHSQGVDLLIHEAYNKKLMDKVATLVDELNLNLDSKTVNNIAAVHTETIALSKLAQQAQVKSLVLTHMIPPIPANGLAESYFMQGMSNFYKGNLSMARDGTRIKLDVKE